MTVPNQEILKWALVIISLLIMRFIVNCMPTRIWKWVMALILLGLISSGSEAAMPLILCISAVCVIVKQKSRKQNGNWVPSRSLVLLAKAGLFIMGATLVFLVWLFFKTRSPFGTTDFLKPDYFTIADKQFSIPRAYVFDRSAWGGGARDGVILKALLPNFEPYSQTNKAEFDRLGYGKKILFFISEHRTPTRKVAMTRQRLFDIRVERAMGPPKEGPYGFTWIETKSLHINDIFYRTLPDGTLFFLECSRPNDYPSPACESFFEYSEHVYIHYHYALDYLKEWQSIDEGLYQLIHSFEASANNPPTGESK